MKQFDKDKSHRRSVLFWMFSGYGCAALFFQYYRWFWFDIPFIFWAASTASVLVKSRN